MQQETAPPVVTEISFVSPAVSTQFTDPAYERHQRRPNR